MDIITKSTWNYMADGSIVIEEEDQPLKVIDPGPDGYIRFTLRKKGPAISDPAVRLATKEERIFWWAIK